MIYKQNRIQKACWIIISVVLLIVFSLINKSPLQKIGLFLGSISIIISLNVLWRWMGWKTLFIIISITCVDIDHFLFKSKGFFETPEHITKILHAFHSIEMLIVLMIINLFTKIDNIKKGVIAWVFPNKNDCNSSVQYYFIWIIRIITFGVLIHYLMDLFIYAFGQKWGYYDYSVIHWLLNKE